MGANTVASIRCTVSVSDIGELRTSPLSATFAARENRLCSSSSAADTRTSRLFTSGARDGMKGETGLSETLKQQQNGSVTVCFTMRVTEDSELPDTS